MAIRGPSAHTLLSGYVRSVPALLRALHSDTVRVDGAELRIPGGAKVRASVIAGNVRMRALLDAFVSEGDTVVDVGANIGAVTVHAARCVGPKGRVVAVEPAEDNLAVLRRNIAANACGQVVVVPAAAGRHRESREFFLRGDISAVNSFFRESCYAEVTGVTRVEVVPLDEIVERDARVVKIDVEGAELDVLAGMPRLLANPRLVLVVEWHPVLQRAAGYEADELPQWLLDRGFEVDAVGHSRVERLPRHSVQPMMAKLNRARRPVELLARRLAV